MRSVWVVAAFAILAGGCKKSEPARPAEAHPGGPGQPAPPTVGTADPFALPSKEARQALDRGHQAARAKKWDEAQAAFRQAIQAAPDHAPAHFALVRALIGGGAFAEVPAAWEALVARDLVGYAGRLEQDKAYQRFRQAPEWAKVQEIAARYREAWRQGLDRGLLVVARTRPAAEPRFDGGATEAPLELRQEVFHYDLATKRFRRLTDTGGHAFAIHRAPDGTSLSVLAAPRLHREGGLESFVDPQVLVLELKTLETVGPFVQKGRFDQVMLGTNKVGQPLFTFVVSTGSAVTYTLDTAKSGLAKLEGDGVIPEGAETRAWPSQVARVTGKAVAGVKIVDGANQFTIDGVAAPVIAARPIAQSSLDWSPGRGRLTYAGKLDACKILKGATGEKNELYVYDVAKKTAQRVAAAVSHFETLWLDDDHLVYEGGVGKAGKIHFYAFTTHADSMLPTRWGAGLYGVPTLACEQAETGVDEDLGDTEEEGD